MNALNFLKHKSEVIFVYEDFSMKRAMDEFRDSGYTALPILARDGRYVGSITEGDFLRFLLRYDLIDMGETEQIEVRELPRKSDNLPIMVDARMEDLMHTAAQQNFVPMVDGRGIFMGIVTRRDILNYFCGRLRGAGEDEAPAEMEKSRLAGKSWKIACRTGPNVI